MTKGDLSYGEKIAADAKLTIYCAPCGRSVEFDPTNITKSERPLGARFRCSVCREYGICIASPKWRYNTFDERIPYGTPPDLPEDFYGNGNFIGPRLGPIRKRRRKRT